MHSLNSLKSKKNNCKSWQAIETSGNQFFPILEQYGCYGWSTNSSLGPNMSKFILI